MVVALLWIGIAEAQEMGPPPPPDARAQYEAAYELMLRGEFGAASAGFSTAAAMTDDVELRSAASQLARLAGELAQRNARLVLATAPGVPAPDLTPRVESGAPAVSEDDAPDGGRATFVVTTTIASIYSGVVLIDLLDAGDSLRASILVVMGTTAAGVTASLYGTANRRMTAGMADAWSTGLWVGAANSLLLSAPLGLYEASNASEKVNLFVLGTTWGTATAALLAADHYSPTRAQVSVTSTFGLMGMASTWLSLAMIQPNDLDGNAFLTITALGLDAGIGVGAAFAGKLDWSLSRARYVGLGALLGGLAGGGTSALLLADTDGGDNAARTAAAITLAGLWGGFALTTHLTRNMAPDYRFRVRGNTQMMLGPTRIREATGLALVGTF